MKKSSEWKFPRINITMREVAWQSRVSETSTDKYNMREVTRQSQVSETHSDKYDYVRGCEAKTSEWNSRR